MYRVITSASKVLAAYSSKEMSTKLANLRKDIRVLSRCDTYDDVVANADNFSEMNVPRIIKKYLEKGMDFDEAYDKTLDSLTQLMSIGRKEHDDSKAKESKMDKVSALLSQNLADAYPNIVQVDPYKFYLVPKESATQSDCVAFVDYVKDTIRGKYYGTGRGGSWTTWNLRSSDDVAVNVGWSSSDKSWAPEDAWIVEIVYNN